MRSSNHTPYESLPIRVQGALRESSSVLPVCSSCHRTRTQLFEEPSIISEEVTWLRSGYLKGRGPFDQGSAKFFVRFKA